jgi:hypothetical protein
MNTDRARPTMYAKCLRAPSRHARPGGATPAGAQAGPAARSAFVHPAAMGAAARAVAVALSLAASAFLSAAAHAQAAAAFRFGDLDLRDPHLFTDFFGCRDITDTPLAGFSVNGELQTRIQTDTDGDGALDLSYLVEFLPLDRGLTTNLIDFGLARCSAPVASTQCTPVQASALAGDATLAASGACMAVLPGTTRPYAPAIVTPSAPCFTSPTGTLTLSLGGVPVTLRNVSLAATFVGNPGDSLSSGLLRGFLSEADADATILPPTLPLIGGRPLSALLPGGTGACPMFSDKDVLDGVVGWWFYLAFPAGRVVLVDPFEDGFAHGFEP